MMTTNISREAKKKSKANNAKVWNFEEWYAIVNDVSFEDSLDLCEHVDNERELFNVYGPNINHTHAPRGDKGKTCKPKENDDTWFDKKRESEKRAKDKQHLVDAKYRPFRGINKEVIDFRDTKGLGYKLHAARRFQDQARKSKRRDNQMKALFSDKVIRHDFNVSGDEVLLQRSGVELNPGPGRDNATSAKRALRDSCASQIDLSRLDALMGSISPADCTHCYEMLRNKEYGKKMWFCSCCKDWQDPKNFYPDKESRRNKPPVEIRTQAYERDELSIVDSSESCVSSDCTGSSPGDDTDIEPSNDQPPPLPPRNPPPPPPDNIVSWRGFLKQIRGSRVGRNHEVLKVPIAPKCPTIIYKNKEIGHGLSLSPNKRTLDSVSGYNFGVKSGSNFFYRVEVENGIVVADGDCRLPMHRGVELCPSAPEIQRVSWSVDSARVLYLTLFALLILFCSFGVLLSISRVFGEHNVDQSGSEYIVSVERPTNKMSPFYDDLIHPFIWLTNNTFSLIEKAFQFYDWSVSGFVYTWNLLIHGNVEIQETVIAFVPSGFSTPSLDQNESQYRWFSIGFRRPCLSCDSYLQFSVFDHTFSYYHSHLDVWFYVPGIILLFCSWGTAVSWIVITLLRVLKPKTYIHCPALTASVILDNLGTDPAEIVKNVPTLIRRHLGTLNLPSSLIPGLILGTAQAVGEKVAQDFTLGPRCMG